jgi:transcriptional regulator with XRE-family HTH domain
MEKSEKARRLRIKELMQEKKWSREKLAEAVGVSVTTISNINSGQYSPSLDTLMKIAEVLEVDVRELFNPSKEQSVTYVEVNKAKELLSEALKILGDSKP